MSTPSRLVCAAIILMAAPFVVAYALLLLIANRLTDAE